MAVQESDLILYECQYAPAEDDEASTCGGTITANEVGGILDEIFETIKANPGGGADKYRYAKVFYKNNNGADTLYASKVWISSAPPSGFQLAIGIGASGDTTVQGTPPSGVTFYNQTGSSGDAVDHGDLAPGVSIPIWIRIILVAGTAPNPSVNANTKIQGTTT